MLILLIRFKCLDYKNYFDTFLIHPYPVSGIFYENCESFYFVCKTVQRYDNNTPIFLYRETE